MTDGWAKLKTARERLDEWFFPDTPSSIGSLRRWEYALAVLAALALATIAELLRPGLAGSIHTLWAEDSAIFMQGAVDHSLFDVVLTVYPEYLVVGPRLIAELATLFPLRDAAVVVAVVSALLVALSGFVVWVASAGLIRNPYLRSTLAVVAVLAPVSGLEAVDSASYVSWYMLVASFWLLFYRPRTTWAAILAGLFLLFTGLSNPGIWFFAPLAGLRLVAIRDRRDAVILCGYAIPFIAQIPASLEHPSVLAAQWSNTIGTVFLQRVLNGAVFGFDVGGDLWDRFGWTLLVALIVFALVGFALGLRQASGRARCVVAISVALSVIMFSVSMYQRAMAPAMYWPAGAHLGFGGRYAIVPAMLLIGAALVLIDDYLRRGRRLAPWMAGAAIAVLVAATASSYLVEETSARGNPEWTSSYDFAKQACEHEPFEEATIRTMPPGFGLHVPCTQLTSNAAISMPASP